MSAVFDLKRRLAEMGIEPKKALGQNFLISEGVIGRIVEAARAVPGAALIEVGPGLGALTEPLMAAGLRPSMVVEYDRDLAAYWRGRGLEVVEGDALRVDWSAFALEAPALLVSNLPYQISTHLMIERCFGPLAIKYMVLMFQKEVAERLTASPRSKDYGQLSVMAQLHFRMRRVAEASPRDFFPPPKVASRVLAFERVDGVEAELGTAFFKFVKAAFAFRRKFLLKNLKGVVDKSGWARLHSGLEALGFSDKVRAEELSPADFARLFKTVYEH